MLKRYDFDVADIRVFLHFVQERLRRNAVQIQNGQGVPARDVTAEAHAGDVNFVLPHECPDIPDDARTVLVRHNKKDAGRDHFYRLTVHSNNSRFELRAKESSTSRNLLS